MVWNLLADLTFPRNRFVQEQDAPDHAGFIKPPPFVRPLHEVRKGFELGPMLIDHFGWRWNPGGNDDPVGDVAQREGRRVRGGIL